MFVYKVVHDGQVKRNDSKNETVGAVAGLSVLPEPQGWPAVPGGAGDEPCASLCHAAGPDTGQCREWILPAV